MVEGGGTFSSDDPINKTPIPETTCKIWRIYRDYLARFISQIHSALFGSLHLSHIQHIHTAMMIDVVFVYLNESWSTFAFPAGGKIQTDGGQDDDAFVVDEDDGWIPSPTLDVADDPLEALVQPEKSVGHVTGYIREWLHVVYSAVQISMVRGCVS